MSKVRQEDFELGDQEAQLVSHSWEVALPILFCRCFERPTNEVIPFDETLKALSQFVIGHIDAVPY